MTTKRKADDSDLTSTKPNRTQMPTSLEEVKSDAVDANVVLSQEEAEIEINVHPTMPLNMTVARLWRIFLRCDPMTQLRFDLERFGITNGWKFHNSDGWSIHSFSDLASFCGNRTIHGVALYAILSSCYRSTRIRYGTHCRLRIAPDCESGEPLTSLEPGEINQVAQEIVHLAAPNLNILLNGEGLSILDTSINGYEQKVKLGEGSYGEVWKVRRKRQNDLCALKISRYPLTAAELIHARQEVDYMMMINSPYVVKCFNHFEHDKKFYIPMELCVSDLAHIIQQQAALGQTFDVDFLWRIALGCAVALFEVHVAGFLHRDVKPANFLLGGVDGNTIKIADLGLAKIVEDSESTRSHVGPGTLAYKSPQRLNGDGFSKRDDIWALGCTLFEVATFKPPFGKGSNFSYNKCNEGAFDRDLLLKRCGDDQLFQFICKSLTLDSKCRPHIYELLQSVPSERIDTFDINIRERVEQFLKQHSTTYTYAEDGI